MTDEQTWSAERCKAPRCAGRRNCVGFSVSDEAWSAVVGNPNMILCLECFDERAQKLGVMYIVEEVHVVTWCAEQNDDKEGEITDLMRQLKTELGLDTARIPKKVP